MASVLCFSFSWFLTLSVLQFCINQNCQIAKGNFFFKNEPKTYFTLTLWRLHLLSHNFPLAYFPVVVLHTLFPHCHSSVGERLFPPPLSFFNFFGNLQLIYVDMCTHVCLNVHRLDCMFHLIAISNWLRFSSVTQAEQSQDNYNVCTRIVLW